MKRLRSALIVGVGFALSMSTLVAASAPVKSNSNPDLTYSGPTVDTSSALVQLNGDPLSTYVKTKPTQGKKINFSNTTVKSYRAQLSALRNDFKQWLQANAPKAKITGSWDTALNAVSVQLNGTTLANLASAPQVKHAEYQGLYHPDSVTDPDLALISAQAAWANVGGVANAGAGVKVAIVDTGIDITHPCFSDAGYPSQTQLGDHNFTNNKVIAARVFNKVTSKQFTAEPVQEHGTHVAGTVACDYNTPATVNGATIPYGISGVAPAALLGSYVVFPGDVDNARSEDILNALESAYADGMDIANMSLGGGHAGIQDLLTQAVDDLDVANMVVAVAAGNSGEGQTTEPHAFPAGHFTVESPGSAARALTAGAFSVGHNVESLITQGSTQYGTTDGDFAYPPTDLTAATVISTNGGSVDTGDPSNPLNGHDDGCNPYSALITGEIAIVARGECTFAQKVQQAQAAGAAAVIVVNRDAAPIPMADDPTFGNTIPAVMVGLADGLALYANVPADATIGAPQYVSVHDPSTAAFAPAESVQSSFSSQGPTDVDFRVKPDVMAPGENVLSSIPAAFCAAPPCFAFFAGTSMATPHLAGSAAVVKAGHPTWDAWEIRSAIVNTADQGTIKSATDGTTIVTDPNIVGSGRDDVLAAVTAWAALNPVSISFGAVPSGSGTTAHYVVSITNLKTFAHAYSLSLSSAGSGGVTYSLSTGSLNLGANGTSTDTATFTITMTSIKGATPGGHFVTLNVFGTAGPYDHAVVYTLIK